ncbi:tryptophan-rich sensory protein [Amycolatopsis xylanica]|uniref:Tryptophan-rich sensory protein n=1 Tax=Amycolatopsis xylanica TaxID=589385 RepID=A0A1H3S7S0_9PSEU|nr:TspO/MBR family protein [Amycolatopsis xylanica]SDZ34012.1 tryptophan-rich sensory protein [Amycolatopsis xylanica]
MTTVTQRKYSWLALAGFIVAVAVVAVIGAVAAADAKEIYGALDQPPWAPPAWLFGPVWTVLYLMLAVSGWLYWRDNGGAVGLAVYGIGLVVNAAWTPLFFAGGAYGLALADIVLLDITVIVTIVLFRRPAGWLQFPYLAWILYATALNIAILALN